MNPILVSKNTACASTERVQSKKRICIPIEGHQVGSSTMLWGHVIFTTPAGNCIVFLDPKFKWKKLSTHGCEEYYIEFCLIPQSKIIDSSSVPVAEWPKTFRLPWFFGKFENKDPYHECKWLEMLSRTIGHCGNKHSRDSLNAHVNKLCQMNPVTMFSTAKITPAYYVHAYFEVPNKVIYYSKIFKRVPKNLKCCGKIKKADIFKERDCNLHKSFFNTYY